MDDIRPAVRDDARRSMTYAEIAVARGISADSAERLVRRRRWAKQLGNDGTVRVLVPPDEAQPASVRNPGRRQVGHQAGRPPADIIPDIREAIRGMLEPLSAQVVEAAAEAIRVRGQLERAERRVGELTAELDRERERTSETVGRAEQLDHSLAEARISERAAAELAEYATGEAADLRKRLDGAEQRAGEERTRADRERDRAERASARVQELAQAMAEKATTPPPEPPRTRWGRLLRALGHVK